MSEHGFEAKWQEHLARLPPLERAKLDADSPRELARLERAQGDLAQERFLRDQAEGRVAEPDPEMDMPY